MEGSDTEFDTEEQIQEQEAESNVVEEADSIPVQETRSTPIPEIETTPVPEIRSTPVPEIRSTPVPEIRSTPVPEIETTPIPEVETTPVRGIETTPVPEDEAIPVRGIETTPVPEVGTPPISEVESTPFQDIPPTSDEPEPTSERPPTVIFPGVELPLKEEVSPRAASPKEDKDEEDKPKTTKLKRTTTTPSGSQGDLDEDEGAVKDNTPSKVSFYVKDDETKEDKTPRRPKKFSDKSETSLDSTPSRVSFKPTEDEPDETRPKKLKRRLTSFATPSIEELATDVSKVQYGQLRDDSQKKLMRKPTAMVTMQDYFDKLKKEKAEKMAESFRMKYLNNPLKKEEEAMKEIESGYELRRSKSILRKSSSSDARTALSDDEDKRRRSSVKFNEQNLRYIDLSTGELKFRRSLSALVRMHRKDSTVTFSPTPDFILDEKKKSSKRSGSVSFPDSSRGTTEEVLTPSKRSSSARFSLGALVPEKESTSPTSLAKKEQEGLALRFKSISDDKDDLDYDDDELALITERDWKAKQSIDRLPMMEAEQAEEEQVGGRRESTAYIPVTRHMGNINMVQDGLKRAEDEEDDEDYVRGDLLGATTEDLLRGLLPGMEEEEGDYGTPYNPEEYSDLPEVLDVDNPLMKKFQDLLKNHLLSQIDRLTAQIYSMKHDMKKVGEEAKEVADSIYKEERFLAKQEEDINTFKSRAAEIAAERIKLDQQHDQESEKHKSFSSVALLAKKQENDLIREKELIAELVVKLKEMEAQKDAELKFSKSETDNARIEKERLANEKLKQDFILWKLEGEVMRLNREMEMSLARTVDLQDEVKCVGNLADLAEADLNAKREENQMLKKAIQQNFGFVAIRDKEFIEAKEKVEEARTHWLMMINSINGYAKDVDKEMCLNERHAINRKLVNENLDHFRLELKNLAVHQAELESNETDLRAALEVEEGILDDLLKSYKDLENTYKKLDDEKVKQEYLYADKKKQYVDKFMLKITTQKMSDHMDQLVKQLAEENKVQEGKISEQENILAKLMVDVEEVKLKLNKNDFEQQNIHSELAKIEVNLKAAEIKKKRMREKLLFLSTKVRVKKQKIKDLENKIRVEEEGIVHEDRSAAARKLRKLERLHKEMARDADMLSSEWLDLQNAVLEKKDERYHQIHEINISKKHNVTMENSKKRNDLMLKNIRSQITKSEKETERETRLAERLQGACYTANTEIQNQKNKLLDMQNCFSGLLQDAECEALEHQKDHCNLIEELEDMTEQLKQGHKTLLELEKRWNLALEAKSRIDKERESGGELANMKREIHRMEVRYNQLKKAQEKLMNDLEMTIVRRDKIVDNIEAREKRTRQTGKQFSRQQLQKKSIELRKKIQALVKKRKELVDGMELAKNIDQDLRNEYVTMKASIEKLKEGLDQLEKQIEEGQVHKHACLETTVARQRKCKFFEDIKYGKYRCILKTPEAQLAEKKRLEQEQHSILEVIEGLKEHFPQLNLQLLQVENTLKSDGIFLPKCPADIIQQFNWKEGDEEEEDNKLE